VAEHGAVNPQASCCLTKVRRNAGWFAMSK
jgi:hypothetical protein